MEESETDSKCGTMGLLKQVGCGYLLGMLMSVAQIFQVRLAEAT